MKILIMGSRGFIGQKLLSGLNNAVGYPVPIYSPHNIENAIRIYNPAVIINCIGRTGRPNIDWCEDHRGETLFANLTVPLMLADQCLKHGITLVHIGTGCIYQGGIFSEEDTPNFIRSYYSKTKYLAEQALSDYPNVLQVRIRMPIDYQWAERNLVVKLFSYAKVIDVVNSVTVLDDLVDVVERLIERAAVGIFNVVNPEPVTHKEIIEIFEPHIGKFQGNFIDLKALVTRAGRSNCVLSSFKLRDYGVYMRATHQALLDCARRMRRPDAAL